MSFFGLFVRFGLIEVFFSFRALSGFSLARHRDKRKFFAEDLKARFLWVTLTEVRS